MKGFEICCVTVPTTGLKMEVLEAGDGPPIVFLHGFPEMAESWRHQLAYFSERGRKAIAPNLRGYGNTDRPKRGYDIDTLTYDIVGLLDAYGAEKADIVAHDWGGVVAWHMAYTFPHRMKSLTILNAPHPRKFEVEFRTNPAQLLKSWYIFAFHVPLLPEIFLGARGAKNVAKIMRDTAVRKEALDEDILKKFSENMAAPGALSAGIQYYRRAFRDMLRLRKFYRDKKISVRTLVIWAQQDAFLGPSLADGLDDYFTTPPKIVRIENCGHWVNQEAHEEVNKAIGEFLS